MFRRYRCFVLAIAGLILSGPCYSQETKGQQTNPGNNPAGQLERIATAIEKQPIASAPDSGCQPGQDNRQSDLCAQWKAADAATDSARWSLWILWVSGLGLLVGGGTLFAAWRAAHWAKRAAEHTQTGATAADGAVTATRESNEIAREALVSQDRAWLDVSVVEIGSLEMDGDEIRITLNFSVKNIGRSPALHINMSTQLVSMIDAFSSNLQKDMIEKLDNYPIDRVRIPGGTLFPERHFTQKRNFSTTGGFVQKNRDAFEGEGDPPVMLNVIGCVQYFLPGSVKPRHTSFAYEINYKGSAQGAIFSESNLPLPPDKIALSVPVARQLIID